jgi:ATP-dependent DNA helicase DinG
VISLRAVEVADLLRDHLYRDRNCVIFTSATLRHGKSFDGFRNAAGLNGQGTRCRIESPVSQDSETPSPMGGEFRFEAIPSPFDPAAVEIAVPEQAVSGAFERKDTWISRVAELLPGLIRHNRGRSLVLFSSYGDLDAVAERVADEIRADGYPLLLQQSGVPTAALCEEFRAIRESVLFGVDTFWYGVDFPGDTLTQVIITRIPFPHPQDPLQIARRNLLPREQYWQRYRYETAIKLRQGFGRLIRSESDRGRIVILDARYRKFNGEGGSS